MARFRPKVEPTSSRLGPALMVMVALTVALSGCLATGVGAPGGGAGSGDAAPAEAEVSGDAAPQDEEGSGPPWTGTNFTWETTNGSTYFAFLVEVDERTGYEWGSSFNATWNDTRGYLMMGQRIHEARGHTPAVAGFSIATENSCSDTGSSPDEPEDCERRDWQAEGSAGHGGFLKEGRYVIFRAAFGADQARFNVSLRTEKSVTVEWIDRGSTRLVTLKDRDATSSYPQGDIQFNANATEAMAQSYMGFIHFAGNYGRVQPSYEVAGPQELDFRRDPSIRIQDPVLNRGFAFVGGYYYSGPDTDTLPRRVPFAQFSAPAGTWNFRAYDGMRWPDGAGFPMLAVMEDPAFVSEEGVFADP